MKEERILKTAKDIGFDNFRIIDVRHLQFDSSFRKFCEDNACGNYDSNYSCPPSCGTPEELKKKTEKFNQVLVLQTITPVRDIADGEETKEIKHRHNQMTWRLLETLSDGWRDYLAAMAGPCGLCEPCAKENGEPCLFPEKKASCMSAYCINVEALAAYCGFPYWCEGKVAFFSLLFF